jgi:hypothetical protein
MKLKKYLFLDACRWRWSDLRYTISCFFVSRQRWLIKKIPRRYADLDRIFEICLLEGIKSFIEKEEALGFKNGVLINFESSQADPEYPEHQKVFDRELKECYELITITLVELEKQLEKEWDSVKIPIDDLGQWIKNLNDASLPYKYGKIDELDKKID